MDPIRPATILAALDVFGAHVDELSKVSIPTLAGGVLDRAPAQQLVARALTDAEHAAELVKQAGLGDEAQRSANIAVRLLEHASLDEIALRSTAGQLRQQLDVIRSSPSLREVEAPVVAEVVTDVVSDATPAVHTPAIQALDDVAFQKLAPDEVTSYVETLLSRHSSELSTSEWSRLGTLLEHQGDNVPADLPRKLEGSKSFGRQAYEIADGAYTPGYHMQRYFDQFAVNRMDTAARSAAGEAFLSRDPETLTPADWTRLATLLENDPKGKVIPIARKVDGSLPLAQQAREIAAGEYRPSRHMHVYFDRYAVAKLTPEARVAEADALLVREPNSLTDPEWRRLAALIDSDPDGSLIHVERKRTGSLPLSEQARDIAAGDYRPSAHARGYFEAYAVDRLGPSERAAAADALLSRDPDTLTEQEWIHLAALVDADKSGSLIPVARKVEGALPLSTQARQIADGEYRPSRHMRAYFDLYAVNKLAPAERAATAKALLARNPDDLTDPEWRQLAALVESDSNGSLITVERKVEGSLSLTQQAREIADGKYRPTSHMHVYFDHYAVSGMPKAERAAEAHALLLRMPSDLSNAEWRRLAALVESDTKGSLIKVSRKLDGSLPLTKQAREIADGEYRPSEHMERYFTEYARTHDPTYATRLEAALEDVVGGGGSIDSRQLVAREWDRLAELVEGRPPDEQAAIAQVMMELDSVAASRSVKSTLELLRRNMPAESELAAPLVPTRNETIVLIERNLARLNGTTPEGAVQGYADHPDYAEIGRIRANMEFLQEAQRFDRIVAAGNPASGAIGAKVEVAAGGEKLTW